ncbi:hypothetical protein PLICRDRAFT_170845 [Plicaturopsis crispa FD-325 SS-3]|nr:hypothetical protein PLICRDRAFT_170845 [Plicaturopsis crispa FD-325 SS-3]
MHCLVHYDAYKTDVYTLGCVYRRALCQKFTGLEFLQPLVAAMTDQEPSRRPSAADAVALFRRIRGQLDPARMRRRLRPVHETFPMRVVRDAVAAMNSIVRRVE